MSHIKAVIAGRIERLEEMIALHEEIAGEEAIELADAASFDPGPEAERLRRFQAAKSRGAEADAGAVPEDAGGEGETEEPSPQRARRARREENDGIRNARTKPIPGGTNGRPSPQRARRARREENDGIRNARTKPIPGAGWDGVERGRERWRTTSN